MAAERALSLLPPGWMPISRENWDVLMSFWIFFPTVTIVQWLTPFYPQGKTSIASRLNVPGRVAWPVMETPGFVIVLATWVLRHGAASLFTGWRHIVAHFFASLIPFGPKSGSESQTSLPFTGTGTVSPFGTAVAPFPSWPRVLMVSLFVGHYLYRAYVGPVLLNPSMSPIHPAVFFSAAAFQVCNGLAIGGWIAGFGDGHGDGTGDCTTDLLVAHSLPGEKFQGDASGVTSTGDAVRPALVAAGLALWVFGWVGNVYHEEVLRDIRRRRPGRGAGGPEERKSGAVGTEGEQKETKEEDGKGGEKEGDESAGSSPSPSPSSSSPTSPSPKSGNSKFYAPPPPRGLFRYMLYPHYFCEWIEWFGFWLIGAAITPFPSSPSSTSSPPSASPTGLLGLVPCLPALVFLLNEVATMTPRARQGLEWYRNKFGDDGVVLLERGRRTRGAVSPWW